MHILLRLTTDLEHVEGVCEALLASGAVWLGTSVIKAFTTGAPRVTFYRGSTYSTSLIETGQIDVLFRPEHFARARDAFPNTVVHVFTCEVASMGIGDMEPADWEPKIGQPSVPERGQPTLQA